MNQKVLVAGATSNDLIFLNGSCGHTPGRAIIQFLTQKDVLNILEAFETKN